MSAPVTPAAACGREASKGVVVLVVGIPGAGKTVLIDRAAKPPEWTVLDPDRVRRRLSPALRKLPIPYPLFVVSVVVAVARDTHVVVESRGTYAWLRRLVTTCARICGREAVIVLLDAPPRDAIAGQKDRGRVAPAGVMRWNTARWSELLETARGGGLAAEGWARAVVIDRAQADLVDDLGELVCGPPAGPPATDG